jgi:hypothetical protein
VHLEGGLDRVPRVGLARGGHAEHRQDAISVNLAHGTAVLAHHVENAAFDVAAQAIDLFRIVPLAQQRVVAQVGEDDDDVASRPHVARCHGSLRHHPIRAPLKPFIGPYARASMPSS